MKREFCRIVYWGDFVMYVFCGKRDLRWIEKKFLVLGVLGGYVQLSFFFSFFLLLDIFFFYVVQ